MSDSIEPTQLTALLLFGLAILHTFSVKFFHEKARKYPQGSTGRNLFHLLGEVEIVFGLWAAVLLFAIASFEGRAEALTYFESRNFSEPVFVFVILSICSTKPILESAEALIGWISRLLPLPRALSFYFSALVLGPILGSFITEPAAMTVTAFLLLEHFYEKGVTLKLKYATLGVLFVNVSIGGTLTPYAAPPVLMVAGVWNWDLPFMMSHFGWKGALACAVSAGLVSFRFKKELAKLEIKRPLSKVRSPLSLKISHLLFLAATVTSAHHPVLVVGIFLFFLGFTQVTASHQESLKLKEGLLVAFFLAGLVVLGGKQNFWLEPLLSRLSALPLYLGAIGLTAFTDNAALTYLGSLVPSLAESSRYALVSGAVVGGGLTVIANAPNPAGYSILNGAFGKDGISPVSLFTSALIPTSIAALCFWLL